MKRLIALCVAAWIGCGIAQASLRDSVEVALRSLDSLIERRGELHQQHEAMLDSLKREMNATKDVNEKYQLCGSLFYHYLHYQTNSSLYYVDRKESLLPRMNRPDLKGEIYVNRAEVLLVSGKLSEAWQELSRINPGKTEKGLRQYYYSTYCNYYIWMAGMTMDKTMRAQYYQQANHYRDSILQLLPAGVNHDIVFSNLLLEKGNADSIIYMLEKQLRVTKDSRERTNLHYNLSEAYAAEGDTLRQVYHLAQTAILDIKQSIREYMALPMLAWLVYNMGEVERAYAYTSCSLQDAADCHSYLRLAEGGKFIPLIQRGMAEKIKSQYSQSHRLLMICGLMLALLLATLGCLAWWMRKLSKTRKLLEESNRKLEATNQTLVETGKVKDLYIRNYMDRCVGYIERMEQYRLSLEKLAMAHKTADLHKTIRSDEFLWQERKGLYAEFDKSFMKLFPNFIEDLNKLLAEGYEVNPKPGEPLSTELRVLAMIRLGVTDTTRISHFLNCSTTTVYNYRSRMRNRTKGDKNQFEEEVMNCGNVL